MKFEAQQLINETIERHKGKICVACSFGKDSIVVLHMALKADPNIKVMFENTCVEFPENIVYKEMICKLWNLNIIETKPCKTFWQCVDQYGIPKCRKAKGKGSNSPKCCLYLKEKPAKIIFEEHGITATITRLMKCENRNRALLITRYDNGVDEEEGVGFCGQRYYARTQNMWKIHPIAHWKTEGVWEFIFKNKIPVNPVYWKWDINGKIYTKIPSLSVNKKDGLLLNGVPALYQRVGCLPCTAYLDWEQKLSISHPSLYKTLKEKQNLEVVKEIV